MASDRVLEPCRQNEKQPKETEKVPGKVMYERFRWKGVSRK